MARLIAPVLCFTAEDVWQELESQAGRESWAETSVHIELFPEPLDADTDHELLSRWERLRELREEVNKALEEARRDGRIRGSLEARVVIDAPDDTRAFLESFGDDLRFLFITSGVDFGAAGDDAVRSEEMPGLAIAVHAASGAKCERCWNWTEDVGGDADWPGVCARCSTSVREILSGQSSA